MIRSGIIMILVVVCVILLAVTNPGQDEFSVWVGNQVGEQRGSDVEEWLGAWVGRTAASVSSDRADYVVASMFTLSLPGEDPIRVLGVLNQFAQVSGPRLGDVAR